MPSSKPKPAAKSGRAATAELQPIETIVFASGIGPEDVVAARRMLSDLEGRGMRRQLFVNEPAEGTQTVKVLFSDAVFPERYLALRNVIVSALPQGVQSDIFRDGFEMLCLEVLLRRDDLDAFVLLRGNTEFEAPMRHWLHHQTTPFLRIAPADGPSRALIFRRGHPQLAALVQAVIEIYQSGAALALPDYALEKALQIAWDVVR